MQTTHKLQILFIIRLSRILWVLAIPRGQKRSEDLEEEKDDLDSTDDRESGEKTHGSSDKTQLGVKLDLLVPLDIVERRRVKEDLHKVKGGVWNLFSWNEDR